MHRLIHWLLGASLAFLAGCPVQAADTGETRYHNPVIGGFSADPSICRVGKDYYLATSSFIYFPGVAIYHSRDLVHWRHIGNALSRPSQLTLTGQENSQGIYAPTLRCEKGRFYLVTTNIARDGNFLVTATDPAGPWSEPIWMKDGGGMDPSLFFDDDGKVYYTRHGGGEHGGAYQAELDPVTYKPKEAPKLIWAGTGGIWPEGPHLYKHNGWYYLMISEGGTSYNHSLTIARAKTPWGPFEPHPNNPLITHRNQPDLPLQAIGHGDLVQAENGSWWMVMLGVRPFDHTHHIGRETMLAPVEWNADGWPVINGGKPLSTDMVVKNLPPAHPWPAPDVKDEFNADQLGIDWYGLRSPIDALWSLTEKPGSLRLKGTRTRLSDIGAPAFLGRRQAHLAMEAATTMNFNPAREGEIAGLAVRQNEKNHYLLVVGKKEGKRVVQLIARVKGEESMIGEAPLADGPVVLSVAGRHEDYTFSFTQKGKSQTLGTLPTPPLSSEKAGGFTGVYVGMMAATNADTVMPPADFDWFSYKGLN